MADFPFYPPILYYCGSQQNIIGLSQSQGDQNFITRLHLKNPTPACPLAKTRRVADLGTAVVPS
jgi:hypothetical protein